MATTADINDVIQGLIETCRDGEQGYQAAADHVKDGELRAYFLEQSSQRAHFAEELATFLQGSEGSAKEQGSVAGAVHRMWIDAKSKMGADDHGILVSVEAGEDRARDAFADALKKAVPAELQATIQRQFDLVKAAHDRVRQLRDQRKAA